MQKLETIDFTSPRSGDEFLIGTNVCVMVCPYMSIYIYIVDDMFYHFPSVSSYIMNHEHKNRWQKCSKCFPLEARAMSLSLPPATATAALAAPVAEVETSLQFLCFFGVQNVESMGNLWELW